METATYRRTFVSDLATALQDMPQFIHVLVGPRQVGKTTGVKQLLSELPETNYLYLSADGRLSKVNSWIYQAWGQASAKSGCELLIIDEIQNVENWSEAIKDLWDGQPDSKDKLKLLLLGSSSISLSGGAKESLAGRYYLHTVGHWNEVESQAAFNLNLDDYLRFGGYPASYALLKDTDVWLHYIKNSIVEPVIAKDLLSQSRVKSAALFKQCFEIVCSYPAQVISYNKLLGQLQDKGNINLVKHYLNLFESAYLIKQLFKFSNKKVLSQSSSPKLLPLCPALYTQSIDGNFSPDIKGRAFETLVGTRLLELPGQVTYWREGKFEVDFVHSYQQKITAIEVKSGSVRKTSGLQKFKQHFPRAEILVATIENYRDVLATVGG